MVVLDADYGGLVRVLLVGCECGRQFTWPAKRQLVECPNCALDERLTDFWHRAIVEPEW
jgi:hypothetical protein